MYLPQSPRTRAVSDWTEPESSHPVLATEPAGLLVTQNPLGPQVPARTEDKNHSESMGLEHLPPSTLTPR